MIYRDKIFKPYDDMYFVSEDGDMYSTYKKGLLKQNIDCDGYARVDIHGKHTKIHKLVYMVWKGIIPYGMQVNHLDDDKSNNHFTNLYLGTQKENIEDCERNGHRVGNVQSVLIYDKEKKKSMLFPSVYDFICYTGHSVQNGSIAHCKTKKWFKDRYEIIEQKGVSTIESYKSIRAVYDSGVENKAEKHEASRVERGLSSVRSARA